MTDYTKRVLIPHEGHPSMSLCNASGTLVAEGYVRVVFGGRGPYVEFSTVQIRRKNMRWIPGHLYFYEYRTNDGANTMVYRQRRTIGYADYRVGLWYVSPFDLFNDCKEVVTKL
jgi:hypothetical protein